MLLIGKELAKQPKVLKVEGIAVDRVGIESGGACGGVLAGRRPPIDLRRRSHSITVKQNKNVKQIRWVTVRLLIFCLFSTKTPKVEENLVRAR